MKREYQPVPGHLSYVRFSNMGDDVTRLYFSKRAAHIMGVPQRYTHVARFSYDDEVSEIELKLGSSGPFRFSVHPKGGLYLFPSKALRDLGVRIRWGRRYHLLRPPGDEDVAFVDLSEEVK